MLCRAEIIPSRVHELVIAAVEEALGDFASVWVQAPDMSVRVHHCSCMKETFVFVIRQELLFFQEHTAARGILLLPDRVLEHLHWEATVVRIVQALKVCDSAVLAVVYETAMRMWVRSLCLTVPTLDVTACNVEGGKDMLLGSSCLQLDGICGIWEGIMVGIPGTWNRCSEEGRVGLATRR